MSATQRRLEFGATVEDPEHWSAEHLAAAEADPGGFYDDWVVEQMEAVMRDAGNAFIAANPDLFRLDELI